MGETQSVKIYTTQTCPFCVMAKDYLKEKGISYEEINVAEDEAAYKEMQEKSGQRGVPVIDAKGQIIVGFNQPQLEAVFGNK